jgi:hypothetical protein
LLDDHSAIISMVTIPIDEHDVNPEFEEDYNSFIQCACIQDAMSSQSFLNLDEEQAFANATLTDDQIIGAVTQQTNEGDVEDPLNELEIVAEPLYTNLSEQEKIVV